MGLKNIYIFKIRKILQYTVRTLNKEAEKMQMGKYISATSIPFASAKRFKPCQNLICETWKPVKHTF